MTNLTAIALSELKGKTIPDAPVKIYVKITFLKPMKTGTMKKTALCHWDAFLTFDLPQIIQSYYGTEFVNTLIKAFTSLHGIDHRLVTQYYPRAN